MVGRLQFHNVIGSEQSWKSALIVQVASFDFALGLVSRSITQGHTVKVKGCSQLGKSVGCVREKERMIVHVKRQGQATGAESPLQEVQMRQESFSQVKPSADIKTSSVIQQVE